MEIILLLLAFGLFRFLAGTAMGASAPPALQTQVSKNNKKIEKFTLYDVKVKGSLANPYPMKIDCALYIYDSETKLPFLSNFPDTDESISSRVFRFNNTLGYHETGKYYKDWVELFPVILEGIQHPYKGTRNVDFTIFYFDADNPVIFKNGAAVDGLENCFHHDAFQKTMTFDDPGYVDEMENSKSAKPLMVDIAMEMAMSDGSLAKSEGEVIKKWIQKEIQALEGNEKVELKAILNKSLEQSYKKLKSGKSISQSITKFKKIASKNLKFQVIELCLQVLSADGIADDAELVNLQKLSKKIGMDFDEVQKLKEKTLIDINLDTTLQGDSAADETIVGMDKNLSKDEALKFINREFKKWNGRLNSLEAGKKRDNAQLMLDTLSRLRKKYEKE